MFKKKYLGLAIAATLAAGSAQAALETSVTLKNETAYMTSDSIRTGEATSQTDTTGDGKGVYKFENTAKIYLNDELSNGASWHGELNIVRDTKAINDYQGHETNTQRDWLRELYVDTTLGDWDVRLGKQQIVWGTADGLKLLDMINPTDWSEFNQNTPADARIPVWMVNAEKYLEDGSNIQVVLSEAVKNKIAGLNASGDQGHPFVMKGVDAITGKVNGFYNVVPALAGVASTFSSMAAGFGFTSGNNLSMFGRASTDGFVNNTGAATTFAGACNLSAYGSLGGTTSSKCLANIANNGLYTDSSNANSNTTNLIDVVASGDPNSGAATSWNIDSPDSAFELMPNSTFTTFNTFAGATAEYVVKKPSNTDANFATRFKNTTDSGVNYSLNYAYRLDSNPAVSIGWYDATTNEKLTTEIRQASATDTVTVGAVTGYYATGSTVDVNNLSTSYTAASAESVLLKNAAGEYYGATDFDGNSQVTGGHTTNAVKMRFTEEMKRIHSLGGSFDMAADLGGNPVVFKGEFVYDKDTYVPVIDKRALGIGDLEHGMTSQKADMFKYVLGAETTIATDLLASAQFIQFRNLDFKNTSRTCTTESGSTFDCSTYTGDMATLSLTNGLKKAEKNKEFYSLFLSKPFGESGEGRWNNIFIYEEGGGKWNRFDVEYGFDDQLIGTFEVNKYFGDNNTMFGQFENASNVQIGVKYLLQ